MGDTKLLDATEVAKHNTPDSCWVILYGNVYDVTDFLPSHPGGAKVILQLAGKDATEDYDPIHPTGTLESALNVSANLGPIDPSTVVKTGPPPPTRELDIGSAPLDALLNLDDFEAVAKRKLSEKAWAYYYSAADDLVSKSLNSSAYRQILFRPRVFVDVEKVDTSTSLLGHNVSLPIYVSPAAMARLGHPAGEHGIAQACGKNVIIQIISNNASQTVEEIVATPADGQVFGFQLYVQTAASKSEEMLRRVEATGRYTFVVLTLDAPTPGKREDDERAKNAANTNVTSAVGTGTGAAGGGGLGKALFAGTSASLSWKATLPWLTKSTKMPIVLKGLQCWEDAKLASEHKEVKGIILSNHGGRSLDGAPPAVYTLLEMRRYCPEVFDKLEVWIDGGVKRGSDVVKALCLGARGVGIGRAALFGLSVGGPEGVERVIEILREEVETDMRLLGVTSIKQLGMQCINTRALDPLIWDGGEAILHYKPRAKI